MSIQTIGPLRIVHFIVVSDVEDHAIKWSFSVCVNFKGDQSEVSRQKKGKSGRGKTGDEVHCKGSCLTVDA